MPPDGAFVFLFEYTAEPGPAEAGGGLPEFPPRPAHFMLDEETFTPYECYGESYMIRFEDGGRRFQAHLAFGPEATGKIRAEALAVLDSLAVAPRAG